jgi:hypothetical protein
MDSRIRIAIFWVPYPALSFPADCSLKSSHAPSAHRMTYGPHHGPRSVGHRGGDGMGHAVGRKSSPRCSFWAAGARPIRIPARAQALMLHNDATGLRALGLKPASLLRTAQASLPVPRSHRAPASQGQNQNLRGGDLRTGLRALGHTPFPKTPACAPAPDWRPIPSLRSVIPQAASRARFALDQAPHRSRLGTLPLLSLVGTRSCLYRDRLSQRWGASFSLRRFGAAYHGSPALWGPAQTSRSGERSSCRFLRLLRQPARIVRSRSIEPSLRGSGWAASARPVKPQSRATLDQSQFTHRSIDDQTYNKELIKAYASH